MAAENLDQRAHGGAGGKDVVDEKEGRRGIGDDGLVGRALCRGKGRNTIYVAEFGQTLSAGKLLAGEGRTGFEKEGREVAAVEMSGQGLSQDIEGGGKFCSGE